MKTALFLSLLIFLTFPAYAEQVPSAAAVPVPSVATIEKDIVRALVIFCLPPIIKNLDPAIMATATKMVELPPESAIRLDRDGGRVFGIPGYPDRILIIAGKNGACSIVAREFDTQIFWQEIDRQLVKELEFKLLTEKSIPGGKSKSYDKYFNGPTALFVSARDAPQEGMLQGILTFARVAN